MYAFFKRYVFIQSTESKEILVPDHIIVTYEGSSYKVYLEIENKCKICHEPHPTNKCPTKHNTEKSDLTLRLDKAKLTQNNQNNQTGITPIERQENTTNNQNTDTETNESPNDQEMQEVSDVTQNESNPTQGQETETENTYKANPDNSQPQQTQQATDADMTEELTTQNDTFCSPRTPVNENNKRVIERSPSQIQPQAKKLITTEEKEEIYNVLSDILKNEPTITIDPQELTHLWCELKNSKNKLDIIKNYNFSNADLYKIFHALTRHPNIAKNYKARAKKIKSVIYVESISDFSDESSNTSQLSHD